MSEARHPHKPVRDIEAPDSDLSIPSDFNISLTGKRHFGKGGNTGKAGTKAGPQEGQSIVSILLYRRIAMRLDEEVLDLSPEFCGILIENLSVFGDEIRKFAYSFDRLKEIFRCCVLLSVMEFYDFEYSKEVSEATTLVHSLIQNHNEDGGL